ncbi:retrovirus-related pol polyprotein from transposon TNT 1-94 [Tanacetum coccineum]
MTRSIQHGTPRSKEQCDALVSQVNQKFVEISDLNVSLQEKDLVITTLNNELRKLKGNDLADNVVTKHPVAPEMLKVDIENVMISRVYYVEGLGHNLFSVWKFCDSNLEVAFHQHTCFICNLKVVFVDIVSDSRNVQQSVYSVSGDIDDVLPNIHLARHGLVRGLLKLNFEKDHLCFACAMGKSKKKPYKPKSEDTNQEKLYLLHMDLCGPMRVASVNGKKYILVIVDDYSRFTWVKCLRSKDKAPDFIIKFLKMIQLVIFMGTKAAATDVITKHRSSFRLHHGKTPYELLHGKLPDLSFFHVFGALCYPTNDSENLGKLQLKADISIFISYASIKKAFRIYNRRTRRIIETIHIDFDELTAMASKHSSSGPALHEMTFATISSGLVPNPPPSTPFVPPSRTDWDLLFQPLFDKLLNPSSSVDRPVPEVIAPIAEVVAPDPAASSGSPSSTTVDQDAHQITIAAADDHLDLPETTLQEYGLSVSLDRLDCSSVHDQHRKVSRMCLLTTRFDDASPGVSQTKPDGSHIVHQMTRQKIFSLSIKSMFDDIIFTDPVDTPMVEKSKLDEDTKGKAVDPTHYRGMVGYWGIRNITQKDEKQSKIMTKLGRNGKCEKTIANQSQKFIKSKSQQKSQTRSKVKRKSNQKKYNLRTKNANP